ncbi:trypsin-like serine peptidase [Pseudoponticoccus marisrubri]|nr:trypsin-like peptidase domain-containing protein [Pseudoponticoccus marisrubri]
MRGLALALAMLGGMAGAQEAVGKFNIAGFRTLESCTATLVAPQLVLTAAHCVVAPQDGYLKPVGDMVFVAAWDGAGHGGASRVDGVDVHPEAFTEGRFDLRHDIALVTLSDALSTPPMRVGSGSVAGPLTLMGYRRSRPHRLSVTPYCSGRTETGLWRIACRVEKGQSGGPVVTGTDGAARVVAVIVAIREDEALAVPLDPWVRARIAAAR